MPKRDIARDIEYVKSRIVKKFAPFRKELNLAHERVGLRPVDRLRWLLTFAYQDLTALSQGQFTDLAREIVAFALPRNLERLSWVQLEQAEIDLDSLTHPEFIRVKDSPSFLEMPQKPISKGLHYFIQKFQRLIKQGFDNFFSDAVGWEIRRPPIDEVLKYDPNGIQTRGSNPPPPGERLINLAFDLVKAEGERLDLCRNPTCKRPFVASRMGRARFCSPRCASYVRVLKFRGKTEKLVKE